MAYDDSRKRMETMQAIDLNRIFSAGGALHGNGTGKGGYK